MRLSTELGKELPLPSNQIQQGEGDCETERTENLGQELGYFIELNLDY